MKEFKTKPWKHQLEAVRKFEHKEYGALLMEMGLGKTKTIIDIAANKFRRGEIERVLVICPSPLKRQWAGAQLAEHCAVPYRSVLWESSRARTARATAERKSKLWETPGVLGWLVVNVEVFSAPGYLGIFEAYLKHRPTMIIIDEATRIKNPAANRTGAIRDIGKFAACRFILTGSLITNSPYDAWSPFEFLRPGYWGGSSYYAFRSRYGLESLQANPYGGRYKRPVKPAEIKRIRRMAGRHSPEEIAVCMAMPAGDIRYILQRPELDVPYKHLDELKVAIQAASVQVRKIDALDIPPKIYTVLEIDMSREQKRIYSQLKKEMLAEHQGKELAVKTKLTLVTRLQQVAGGFFPQNDGALPLRISGGNPKISALVGELEDIPGQPVIIWARFVAEIKAIGEILTKELPDREVRIYHGGVPQDTRAGIVEDFQEGIVDVIVANPATAGFGLNLQRSHIAFYYSQGFSLEDRLQSEDRIHRAGQKESCTYIDMVMSGTVDDGVRAALTRKQSLSDYFSTNSLAEFLK